MNTLILRMAARLLVPMGFVFALYIYLKGHHEPGGGFVGGLVLTVTLLIQRLSRGRASMRKLVLLPERHLISIGLALAMLTAALPMLFGKPLLYSVHAGPVSSVMAFDLGVMLVVTGVATGMISRLDREAH